MSTTPLLWKSESQVNTADAPVVAGGTNSQSDGQVVALPDGGYAVVWTDRSRTHNPLGSAIVGQRYDAQGNPAGGEVNLGFIVGDQYSPAVTALPGGGIAVASVLNTGGANLYVRRLDSNLSYEGQDTIHIGNVGVPSITAFSNGSYVVAYRIGTGDNTDIVARRVSAGGVVGDQFTIHDENDNSGNVELATLSNGNFVAVYEDEFNGDSGNTNIRFRILSATGTPVTGSQHVPGAGALPAEIDPDVAALRDGGFVVVWREEGGDASGAGIRATLFNNSGNDVRANFLVNTTQAGTQTEANVVALADGGFLVTWDDDFADVVRGQRFDASGNMVGTEFTVHHGITGDSTAAVLNDGRIAFVIDDNSGDQDVVTSIWDPSDVASINDVLWRHSGGTTAIADHHLGTVANTWQIRGAGDFDGNGDSDILWRHDDGMVVTWEMEAGEYLTNHSLGSVGNSWQIRATGDFDGDGDADIAWHHNDGQVVTWEMEDGGYLATHNLGSVANSWRIIGTGDFDADGDADMLWRHTGGQVVTWDMEGGAYVVNHNLGDVPNSWQIRGTGDFDGDGDADILWHHDSGQVVTWEMEGGAYVANHNLATVGGAWRIRGTADFDSDGDADILWRHDDGTVVTWEMQDGAYLAHESYGPVSNSWRIAATGEFDLLG